MKQNTAFFLLLSTSLGFFSSTSYAQQSSTLAGLHPRPKVSYLRSTAMVAITPATPILISDTASTQSLDYLESILKQTLGYTLAPLRGNAIRGISNAIYLGEAGSYPALDSAINATLAPGETMPPAEGYVLDVAANGIVLAGSDPNGTFNSISTFAQLLKDSTLPSVHINDWPDYPIRWVFSLHNLMDPAQVTALETIEDSMAMHKLNGIQQNDFKNTIFDALGSYYFSHVDTFQAYSAMTNVEIIPGLFPIGWSEAVLYHDPDLAEGIPTTTSFLIQGDTGVLLTDPNMVLPNPGFENVSNGQFTGWSWYDGPKISAFVDSTTVHSGKYSARCTNFTAANSSGLCRFERSMICKPFHGYHISVWMKTENFSGSEVQLLAIGHNGNNSTSLTYTSFPVSGTSGGWNKYDVVFNTLTYDSVWVYCGVWGGSAGTIWFDDFNVEDAGLTNVLRRIDDVPLVTVRGKTGKYLEGKDYAAVIDSAMVAAQGTYPWHTSPGFNVLPESQISSGDTVDIHFIRPNPVINYPNGDGSTMVCVSEDTLYSLLEDAASRVDAQYHSNKYFMSHDEIRVMNWDSACQNRHLSPAQLLADNVIKCDSIMHEIHPGDEIFDWSDMFDSLHNAHNDYYLVNGDLNGDWNLIPKDFTIVNWNGTYKSQSLDFFAKHGFSQITSPYYDVPNTLNMRQWRLAMDTIPNMRGMMYTTWNGDYSFLTPFADYAWSAGPMIVHEPWFTSGGDSLAADVFSDPYLPTDSIVSVKMILTHIIEIDTSTIDSIDFVHKYSNHYAPAQQFGLVGAGLYHYHITAINLEGLSRSTPEYGSELPAGVSPLNATSMQEVVYPNPASNTITVRGTGDERTILIKDILGREVGRFETSSQTSTFDIQNMPAGIYECVIVNTDGSRKILPFVKE